MAILDEGRRAGLHTILARIAEGNEVSMHINRLCGFETIGVMREVGHKFGRRLDVHLMQIIFPEPG
jgi:phosphinothricin acetyltransferase